MAQRTTQPKAASTGSKASSPEQENDQANHVQPPETEDVDDRGDPVPPLVGLKEFVKQYKDKNYFVIEMRIVLICSFSIFFKLFHSIVGDGDDDDEDNKLLTCTTLVYIGLSIVVIISNTWLDYFPSRLVEVQLRESKGQGIPLACLLLPMVCCAQLFFSLHFARHLTDLLQIYLIILCVLSVCSILATLFHFIPHPTHIVFYNFFMIGVTYILQVTIGVPMWMTLPAVAGYSVLGVWLLNGLPLSFTIGEAMIVSQALTILFMDAALQLLTMFEMISLPTSLEFLRTESVVYVELLLVGVAICCLLLSPALYKLSCAKYHHEKKFWSGTFILLSLSIGLMTILPWMGSLLGGYHPIPYLFFFSISSLVRLMLIAFWLVVSVFTAIVVYAQTSDASWADNFKPSPGASWQIRKVFHLSALLVYVTGIAADPDFISVASSIITFIFVVAELGHIFRMWPFGEALHQLFLPLMDTCDSGPTTVSHLYLLLGFSLPLWLYPLRNYQFVSKLSMYSGTLALGIGDSMASIVGKLHGRIKWPGTKKTIEGSFASILSQLVGVFIIVLIDPHLEFLSGRQWAIVTGCIVMTTALEAYTWQIDNLILGVFQYALLIVFLN